jgi:hypothetical protein
MNLYEGNNMSGHRQDITHGSHIFETLFRNHLDGHKNNPPANANSIIQAESLSRFTNVVGNVLGDTGYITTYLTDQGRNDASIYETGDRGDNSGVIVPLDPNVKRTLFRFGNWDTKTNATRFCGNSSNTGWSTTCSSTTEVPTTIANYPNQLPSTETLPASLYMSTKPSWFGAVAWPPIGPDVSGGNITGYGGHAYKIPTRLCFETSPTDAAYGGNVRQFNAATCYGQSGSAPNAPTSLRIIP